MVIDTSHIMVFCDINYIYSKTQFSTTLNNRLKNFIYTTYDGEYYIYSKEPIYSITVTTNEYGKVSLQDDAKYFEEGSDVTYTFTPNIGCYLQSVIIDGKVLTSAEVASVRIKGYTFTNISKNHTISAIFALKDYIIEITSNNFGTIFPNGNVQAKYGEDKTFTIEPNKGYQIQEILVDGVSVDFENNQVTIKNINRNISIHVVFMEQVVPKKLNPMIIILAIGSVILLTFLSVLFSKLRSNAKRKKFQDVMQNILLPENNYKYQRYQTLQQNSNLEKALEFVKGKEQSFMSFCIQNRIDYHKNYNDAVFKYYQAYLQSIKQ